MITVTINDQQHSLRDGITLSALLTDLDVSTRGAAVAVNNRVITRSAWSAHQLHDGDRILIIKAAQGG